MILVVETPHNTPRLFSYSSSIFSLFFSSPSPPHPLSFPFPRLFPFHLAYPPMPSAHPIPSQGMPRVLTCIDSSYTVPHYTILYTCTVHTRTVCSSPLFLTYILQCLCPTPQKDVLRRHSPFSIARSSSLSPFPPLSRLPASQPGGITIEISPCSGRALIGARPFCLRCFLWGREGTTAPSCNPAAVPKPLVCTIL